jgi:hypothetical protein
MALTLSVEFLLSISTNDFTGLLQWLADRRVRAFAEKRLEHAD